MTLSIPVFLLCSPGRLWKSHSPLKVKDDLAARTAGQPLNTGPQATAINATRMWNRLPLILFPLPSNAFGCQELWDWREGKEEMSMAVVKTVLHTENSSHVFIYSDLLFLSVFHDHDGRCGGHKEQSES